MKTTLRLLSWILLAALLALSLLWTLNRQPPPLPSVTLAHGGPTVRVAAVTTGTNHLHGPWLGRALASSTRLQPLAERLFGPRARASRASTLQPSVMLWLEPVTPTPGPTLGRSWRAFLADETGFLSGPDAHLSLWTAQPVTFTVVPRRSPTLNLWFFEDLPDGTKLKAGQLTVPNPWFDTYPQWTPDPLPATRTNGPLVATLNAFTTGHNHHSYTKSTPGGGVTIGWGTNRQDGESRSVLQGHFVTPGAPTERWVIAAASLADATGNTLTNHSLGWTRSGATTAFTLSPSLWPGEHAWRLQLQLKREAGLPPEHLFVLRHLPLPPLHTTNSLDLHTNLHGLTLDLLEFIRRPPIPGHAWSSHDLSELKLQHSPLPPGAQLDLLHVRVANTTNDLEVPSRGASGRERSYHIKNLPTDATALDLTFALQPTLPVEFLVQPELGQSPEP